MRHQAFVLEVGSSLFELGVWEDQEIGEELGIRFPELQIVELPEFDPAGWRLLVHDAVVRRGRCPEGWPREARVNTVQGEVLAAAVARAADFLSLQHLYELLEDLASREPLVVQLVQDQLGWVRLRQVLRLLLQEQVSIRNLGGICETLLEQPVGDPAELCEAARRYLGPAICSKLERDGKLTVRLVHNDPNQLLSWSDFPPELPKVLLILPESRRTWRQLHPELHVLSSAEIPAYLEVVSL